MQAPVFLLEIQHVKWLKSVFLKIYNCAWKVAFLKSSHIYASSIWKGFSLAQGRSHDFLGGQVYFAPSRSYLYFTLRKELPKCSSSYKMHNLFQYCTNNTCKQSMSQLGGLVACHHRKFWKFGLSKIEFESISDDTKNWISIYTCSAAC